MGVVDFQSQGTIGTTLMPKRYDIEIYKGDTFEVILNFKDSSSMAVDLTGFIGLVQFKDANNMVAATPTITMNANGTVGAAKIFIANTATIAAGTYSWDFQLTDSGGRKRTYIGGKVTITQDISE